jgi:hypothetical protein
MSIRKRDAHLRKQLQPLGRKTIEDLRFESVERFSRDVSVAESLAVGGGVLQIISEQFNAAPRPHTG